MIKGFNDEKNDLVTITLEEVNKETMIISFKGSVDTFNSPFVTRHLMMVVNAGYTNLIFNFHRLLYMSSTGIGAMININKVTKEIGGLAIYNMMPKVYEVFKLLGMVAFFNIVDEREEALNLFIKKEKEKPVFPFIFKCPVCEKKLRATKSGRFKCKCETILSIDEMGTIILG